MDNMDNRRLKIAEIEILRRKAVEAVIIHGETQKRASELFGFSQTSMTKYIAAFKQSGESTLVYKKRGVKPGTYSNTSFAPNHLSTN